MIKRSYFFETEEVGLCTDLISGYVGAPVLDPDPRRAVVEVSSVELEELDEEDRQVGLVGLGVGSGVKLQKAHSH